MAISIENNQDAMFMTIIPITILVILEISLAFISMKSRWIRTVLDGKPSLIIYNGIINYKEMIKQRYNLDDLLIAMRQKEIHSIDEVEYAFLEPNGKLSLFKYNCFKLRTPYPIPLIVDGKLNNKTLKKIHKTESWLKNELIKNRIELKNVFYAFYNRNNLFIIKKNNLK